MPSQQNGYDCGLYVCAVADALCTLAAQQQQMFAELEQHALQAISSSHIADLRLQMLQLIEQLAEEEQSTIGRSS